MNHVKIEFYIDKIRIKNNWIHVNSYHNKYHLVYVQRIF